MPQPDNIVNRYRVMRRIGQGGTGSVYLVYDELQKCGEIALKTIDRPEDAHILRQEFILLSTLHHPNLVKVLDYGYDDEDDLYFFTYPFIEGKNIVDTHQSLAIPRMLDDIVQISRALQYIHTRGIIHGDIKPENIIVSSHPASEDERVKLLDFGLARATGMQKSSDISGTLPYMAPEIFLNQSPNAYRSVLSSGD